MNSDPGDFHREQLSGIAKGAAFTLLFQFLDKVLGVLFVVLVPRLIGLANLGIFNIGLSVNHILSSVGTLGLVTAAIREGSVFFEKQDWRRLRGLLRFVVRVPLAVSLAFSLLLVIFARPLAAVLLHDPALHWTFWAIAAALPASCLTLVVTQFSLALRVARHWAFVKHFLEPFTKILFFLLLFWLGLRLGAVVWGFPLSMLVCLLAAAAMAARLLARLPEGKALPVDQAAIMRFSLPLLGPLILGGLLIWIDILLLGFFSGNQEVGLFAIALKLIWVPDMVVRAFVNPVSPRLASMLAGDDRPGWQELYRQVGRWALSLSLPGYLFLLLRAEVCLEVLDPRFVPGAVFVSVMCLGPIALALIGPADTLLAMSGRTRLQLVNAVVFFALNVAGNLVALPLFGAKALAWVLSATSIAYSVVLAVQLVRIFGFFPMSARIWRTLLAGSAAGGFLWWASGQALVAGLLPRLLLEGVVFSAIYFVLLFLLGVDAKDRQVLSQTWANIRDHVNQVVRRDPDGRYL